MAFEGLRRMVRLARGEARASAENINVPLTAENLMQIFGGYGEASSGELVTIDSALGVPAVFAAVNFIAGTIAGLPLQVFRKTDAGRVQLDDDLAGLLHDAPNEGLSSFEWRKYTFEQVLTGGRGLTFIERNTAGRVIGLWPLDPSRLTIARRSGRKVYEYRDGPRIVRYTAAEIIDLPFMLKADGLAHRSPITTNAEAIGMAQAVTRHGGSYFRGGGVPPFAVVGKFQSGRAMQSAADDLAEAVRRATKEKRLALALPEGLDIKTIGTDAEKAQMVETQRFMIEQVARIYSLPPVFLQDLTHGTLSNVEQQDLHFVKHTIKRWVEQFEQEMNLKLFGARKRQTYVEMNLDGLLRGDFKTRMEGYAIAIQQGMLAPGEARDMENRERLAGDGRLYMQGAMVPLDQIGAPSAKGGQGG